MKKIVCLLAVLAMAAPALADVTLTAVHEGGGVVAIGYESDGVLPRAFGLDLTLTGDVGTIDGVSDVSTDFYVFMGTITIVDGAVTDYGSPIAPSDDPGALGGIGTAGATIEMGSLYEMGVDPAPAANGILLRVQTTGATELCVDLNEIRGGVVLEDVSAPAVAGVCVTIADDKCFKEGDTDSAGHVITAADVAQWAANGEPAGWCTPCFASGDANGDCVNTTGDLFMLITPTGFAAYGSGDADFNYDGVYTTGDLFAMIGATGFNTCPVACP